MHNASLGAGQAGEAIWNSRGSRHLQWQQAMVLKNCNMLKKEAFQNRIKKNRDCQVSTRCRREPVDLGGPCKTLGH